jgi:predicted signal transduction protein with EAL and GGDEF domain
MYEAQNLGGHRVQRFEPALLKNMAGRAELATALRSALSHGEFVVHYQPLVTLNGGLITGVEATGGEDRRHRRIGRLGP